ncbi:MAG TPA: hypoxanthine phosphoribosyltransferase [Pirellulales bacterium]|nr:hypoxanthine phosphoribosyltransferase [Pirellulales bacterium]
MKTVLTADQLHAGVDRLGQEINQFYNGQPLIIVGVLTGSIVLLADLIRRLIMPLRVGLVQASSYRGAAIDPGQLTINFDLLPDVKGRHVLLIDDIFDTGKTLIALVDELRKHNPASVRCAVLLRKQGRQAVMMEPEYVGFEIPNAFVVGYGLDYQDAYRNLPYLAALEEHEIGQKVH